MVFTLTICQREQYLTPPALELIKQNLLYLNIDVVAAKLPVSVIILSQIPVSWASVGLISSVFSASDINSTTKGAAQIGIFATPFRRFASKIGEWRFFKGPIMMVDFEIFSRMGKRDSVRIKSKRGITHNSVFIIDQIAEMKTSVQAETVQSFVL